MVFDFNSAVILSVSYVRFNYNKKYLNLFFILVKFSFSFVDSEASKIWLWTSRHIIKRFTVSPIILSFRSAAIPQVKAISIFSLVDLEVLKVICFLLALLTGIHVFLGHRLLPASPSLLKVMLLCCFWKNEIVYSSFKKLKIQYSLFAFFSRVPLLCDFEPLHQHVLALHNLVKAAQSLDEMSQTITDLLNEQKANEF